MMNITNKLLSMDLIDIQNHTWWIISSWTDSNAGPSNRNSPSGDVWTIKCFGELHIT